MTNRSVRIILFIVTALFTAGVTWAIITIARRNNNETVETPTNRTEQPSSSTPESNQSPTPVAENEAVQPVNQENSAFGKPRKHRIIVEEETTLEITEANAWASAGVNPDGSTYAEAHAE